MGFASIGYVPEDGWYAGTEARYMGDIMADDENTAKAPSYTLVGLFTGYKYNYHNLTVDLCWSWSIIYSIKNTLVLSLSMSQTGDITNLRPDEIMVSA
ncbi:TonB-dependent receptor [Escherichia coli]|nr:TonB-dependent receptor [Escherichia coli]